MIGVEVISQVPVNWLKVTPRRITADFGVPRTVRNQRISFWAETQPSIDWASASNSEVGLNADILLGGSRYGLAGVKVFVGHRLIFS